MTGHPRNGAPGSESKFTCRDCMQALHAGTVTRQTQQTVWGAGRSMQRIDRPSRWGGGPGPVHGQIPEPVSEKTARSSVSHHHSSSVISHQGGRWKFQKAVGSDATRAGAVGRCPIGPRRWCPAQHGLLLVVRAPCSVVHLHPLPVLPSCWHPCGVVRWFPCRGLCQ